MWNVEREDTDKESRGEKKEFPGSPEVKYEHFHCRGPGSIPGQGTKIPQNVQGGEKKKKTGQCRVRYGHNIL